MSCESLKIFFKYKYQRHRRGINDLFTRIGEIDRNDIIDARLHLPNAPFRVLRVAHEHSGGEDKMAHSSFHSAGYHTDQTPNHRPDLSELVASRICHDLVSPMGAIGNGLELLNMTQGNTSPEMNLIAQSIENATTRLRFFRITFGAVSDDQTMGRAEILSVLTALDKVQKQTIIWNSHAEMSRRRVKLAFLLIMCLETALPWGGDIRIEDCQDGVCLIGLSERLKIDEDLWTALARGCSEMPITSARIHFALAMSEIAAQHLRLSITQDRSALRLVLHVAE